MAIIPRFAPIVYEDFEIPSGENWDEEILEHEAQIAAYLKTRRRKKRKKRRKREKRKKKKRSRLDSLNYNLRPFSRPPNFSKRCLYYLRYFLSER